MSSTLKELGIFCYSFFREPFCLLFHFFGWVGLKENEEYLCIVYIFPFLGWMDFNRTEERCNVER